MFEILTAEEMQKADAAAIAGGVPGIRLMETAGAAVAQAVEKKYKLCSVLVLCGPGNNGGDGFIAAAILKKSGWPVRVACTVKKIALKGDAALAAKKWDGDVEALNSNLSVSKTELVIDAIFGTGLSRALEPEMITLFDKIRTKKIPVVAVDLPSGINATTGKIADGTLNAEITVTFCRRKIAHVLLPSKNFCGRTLTAQIGITDQDIANLNTQAFENHPSLWLNAFPLPSAEQHKYDRGHVIVYGGTKKTGAACLAAGAAQRAGAGLVTITARPEEREIYSAYRASIMTDIWDDSSTFKAILRDERKNTMIIGPGAESDAQLKESVFTAISFSKTLVLDAGIFLAFKDDPKELFSKLSPDKHVMTPHEGEFERLFGVMDASKLERARHASRISNSIIVLKGPDTVIAAPDGTAIINSQAPATLATAGTGDVLAGLIGGLAAQGMNLFMASSAAVWLQTEAAKSAGLGLIAEDIISLIPQVLRDMFTPPKTDT